MNRKNFWQVAVAALLVAVGASGVTAGQASAAGASRPLAAEISGTVSTTGPLTFELDGTFRANHFGSGNAYQADGTFTGPTEDTLTETLTAANGDTLVLTCAQVLEATSVPGVFNGTETWTVIGGTGRFAGASGSGTGESTVDLNAGTFAKQMTGVVTY